MMNISVLAIDFGSYYSMVGAAQTRAIMAVALVLLALAIIIGAVKSVVRRVRGHND
jgi:succinate dehydrogenase/fumarate reductase cytochrome b subunit